VREPKAPVEAGWDDVTQAMIAAAIAVGRPLGSDRREAFQRAGISAKEADRTEKSRHWIKGDVVVVSSYDCYGEPFSWYLHIGGHGRRLSEGEVRDTLRVFGMEEAKEIMPHRLKRSFRLDV